MSNPNNNKNFNDEALRINRALKKENDLLKEEIKSLWSDLSKLEKQFANLSKLWDVIDEVEDYFLRVNTGFEEEIYTDDIPSSQKIQDMIDKVRSRDEN